MPELPEVETIRRGLDQKIKGKVFTEILVLNQNSFLGQPVVATDRTILGVERRAKVIRIKLDGGLNLLFHLKMTGQLIYTSDAGRLAGGHPSHDWHDKLPNKHTRIIFKIDDNSTLYFNDMRKFGWCKLLTDEEIKNVFSLYGPEPLESTFSFDSYKEKVPRAQGKTIKQFIMDQAVIAGIGNIYADEALYLTKIMPRTKVKMITDEEWLSLTRNIVQVLELAVKLGGTTDSDYVDVDGQKGGMQDYLNVYHKEGSPCPCGGTIEKIVVGGRGTHYCPRCQKEKI